MVISIPFMLFFPANPVDQHWAVQSLKENNTWRQNPDRFDSQYPPSCSRRWAPSRMSCALQAACVQRRPPRHPAPSLRSEPRFRSRHVRAIHLYPNLKSRNFRPPLSLVEKAARIARKTFKSHTGDASPFASTYNGFVQTWKLDSRKNLNNAETLQTQSARHGPQLSA
jgi:hypothetical protein